MTKGKVYVTDYGFMDLNQETKILNEKGYELYASKTSTEDEIIEKAADADALLVQWAPITEKVISKLTKCKIIVRYGIGMDNVDLAAAQRRSIPVCNVPDYCIQEVADHTVSLALACARQLVETNNLIKEGVWKITPPYPMPAFSTMLFATVGYGRIAREVLNRAKSFKFKLGAVDPNVTAEEMLADGVEAFEFDTLIEQADIISMHLPLNEQTHHLFNAETFKKMKKGAILINTSRGGLVDGTALAEALEDRRLVAGLDVFEAEPLPITHPLRRSKNALLTSHTAWYSEKSVPDLQYMAALEVVRGLDGESLKNRVV